AWGKRNRRCRSGHAHETEAPSRRSAEPRPGNIRAVRRRQLRRSVILRPPYYPVRPATVVAASSMTEATSVGCESNDMWLEPRRVVVFADIRLASAAWSSALTTRSSDVMMNQVGFVFQAARATVCPNAF